MKDRCHFSGPWSRRETKDSPFKSIFISPLKLVPLPRPKNVYLTYGDQFRSFFVNHFMFSEEKYYGHIADLVYLSKGENLQLVAFLKVNRIPINPVCKYTFMKEVGSGSFGTVYLAKDKITGEQVAIKRVYASLLNNSSYPYIAYEIEKETLLTVESPHVIKLLSTFQTIGSKTNGVWYVFEFASGGTFSNVIYNNLNIGSKYKMTRSEMFAGQFFDGDSSVEKRKKDNPYFMIAIKFYISQLLAGIVHLHQQNIIHKDIKPENCLITSKGILKITDLGLAAKYRWFYYSSRSEFIINGDRASEQISENDLYLGGTIMYMEPELRAINDEEHMRLFSPEYPYISFQMDYYSIALIIFEMMFGFVFANYDSYIYLPCYPFMRRYLMMQFFPREYLSYLQHVINRDEKDAFTVTLLKNIHNFVQSDEDGLIIFLINGLQFRKTRWTKYCDEIKLQRFNINFVDYLLNLEKIKKNVPFFSGVSFDLLHLDPGFPIANLIKPYDDQKFNELSSDSVLECPYRCEFKPYELPYFNFRIPTAKPLIWDKSSENVINPRIDEITHKLFDCTVDELSDLGQPYSEFENNHHFKVRNEANCLLQSSNGRVLHSRSRKRVNNGQFKHNDLAEETSVYNHYNTGLSKSELRQQTNESNRTEINLKYTTAIFSLARSMFMARKIQETVSNFECIQQMSYNNGELIEFENTHAIITQDMLALTSMSQITKQTPIFINKESVLIKQKYLNLDFLQNNYLNVVIIKHLCAEWCTDVLASSDDCYGDQTNDLTLSICINMHNQNHCLLQKLPLTRHANTLSLCKT